MSQKKKKKNWFEAWCTMDEVPASTGRRTQSKKAGTGSRSRVQSRSAAPYPEDELPPFDDVPVEPINNDEVLADKDTKERSKGRSTARGTGSGRTSASTVGKNTVARRSGGKSASGEKSKKEDKPLPAELAYRMQPYLVLIVGSLLAVMLLISALMSGGEFGWTTATHPFRWVGYHVERALFGLIGCGAYMLPAAMIYLAIVRIREGKNFRSNGRGLLAFAILILFSAMVHTCMIESECCDGALDTWQIQTLFRLGADKLGGGVLGGWLGQLCYVGLGIIGTMIVGVLLLIVLLLLLLRLTPRSIWQGIRSALERRAARMNEYREREAKRAEERATKKKTEAVAPLLPERGENKIPTEEDEIDEPKLKRGRKQSAETDDSSARDTINYLDPTRILLDSESKRAKKRSNDEPYGGNPETVFPEDATSAPIECVNELSREEVEAMERAFSDASVAKTMSPEEEAEEGRADETPVFYPGRAEIDLEDGESVVTPLEAPIDDEDEPEEMDCHDGFDYSMESAVNDDVVEGTEVIGGVEIKVEKLSEEERARGEQIVEDEPEEPAHRPYTYPTLELLNEPKPHSATKDQEIRAKMQKLRETLTNFRVRVEGISYACGPSVTRYEVRPAPGVRVRSIANLSDDIAMSLAAKSIRIEAPIPGKEAVGIEVPNTTRETVYLRRLIDSDDFRGRPSKLTACLGEDVAGNPIVIDLVKMPHLLVAGTTGSGKSVCINDFIMSLLYKSAPNEVKIILIDPKQVEFTVYKDLPHLMAPIVCDPKRAAAALNLAVLEMEKRFQMIRDVGVRDIAGYNAITENDRYEHPYMPQIVIIIDELADLMMQAKDEVETSIVRLAQKARAAGMHLVIGTQRPSVDVITGLIKANVPSRIACTVVSQVDSRTILDVAGAEKLLGMGDMLYAPVGSPKPLRVQGAFVSDSEVERIVEFIKRNNDPVHYDQEFLDNLDREAQMIGTKRTPDTNDDMGDGGADGLDPKFYEALRIAVDNNRISTSLLQRMLSIGYGRAAKIIDEMERQGFVGPAVGNKPREIRITKESYAELIMNKDE